MEDQYIITVAGEDVGKRTNFKDALKWAKRLAKEVNGQVNIDIVERRLITQVRPNGHISGRDE